MRRTSQISGRPLIEPFGVWLADQLEQRGMSKAQFARESGINDGTIGWWLFHSRPNQRSCYRIAEAFGLPAWVVLEAAGYPTDGLLGSPTDSLRREIARALERVPDERLTEIRAFVRKRECQ